jgi:hypothetical protein
MVVLTWYVELGAGASIMMIPEPKNWPLEYRSAFVTTAMNNSIAIIGIILED